MKSMNIKPDKKTVRISCIDRALQVHSISADRTPSNVLKTAKKFEKFINGGN